MIGQLIYTKSKCSISGAGGYGVFNYSKNIEQFVNGLSTYYSYKYNPEMNRQLISELQKNNISEVTNINRNEVMKIIDTIFPIKYIYSPFENNMCVFSYNRYVGAGFDNDERLGNYLSHTILADDSHINNYPILYYKSPQIEDMPSFDEYNKNTVSKHLKSFDTMEVGDILSLKNIFSFVNNNRLSYFKDMLVSILCDSYKHLIIKDENTNILIWINALTRVLPLSIAKNISFSTYETIAGNFPTYICGLEINDDDADIPTYKEYFVANFSTTKPILTETFSINYSYIDFILNSIKSMDFDKLNEFNQFVTKYFNKLKISFDLQILFNLYSWVYLEKDMTYAQLEEILNMEMIGSNDNSYDKNKLFKKYYSAFIKSINTKNEVKKYTCLLLKAMDICDINNKKELILNITLKLFSKNICQEVFVSVNEVFEKYFIDNNLNDYYEELSNLLNMDTLYNIMTQPNTQYWKSLLILKYLSNMINNDEFNLNRLNPNYIEGKIIYSFVQLHIQDIKSSENLLKVVDLFNINPKILLYFIEELSGMLRDFNDAIDCEQTIKTLWDYFFKNALNSYSLEDFILSYQYMVELNTFDCNIKINTLITTALKKFSYKEMEKIITECYNINTNFLNYKPIIDLLYQKIIDNKTSNNLSQILADIKQVNHIARDFKYTSKLVLLAYDVLFEKIKPSEITKDEFTEICNLISIKNISLDSSMNLLLSDLLINLKNINVINKSYLLDSLSQQEKDNYLLKLSNEIVKFNKYNLCFQIFKNNTYNEVLAENILKSIDSTNNKVEKYTEFILSCCANSFSNYNIIYHHISKNIGLKGKLNKVFNDKQIIQSNNYNISSNEILLYWENILECSSKNNAHTNIQKMVENIIKKLRGD